MKIESTDNNTIKLVRSLQKHKYRKEHGLFVVEGKKLVDEALGAMPPKMILVSDRFDAGGYHDPIVVKDSLFAGMCDTQTPQGIVGVFPMVEAKLEATSGVILALEDVQDPGNVGAIIRSADAFGAAGVICSPGCADLHSPKVIRAAMGSSFHLPVVRSENLCADLQGLKTRGCTLVAGDLQGEAMQGAFGFAALVVGNEGSGISPEVRRVCDVLWKIPMAGDAESLNVSVATGILLYKLCRV